MTFFDRLFGNNEPVRQPHIRFGRYSDVYHATDNDEAFDISVREFEDGHFQNAYLSFFKYLRNEEEDNVKVWQADDEVKFEFYQGSKKITGYGNDTKMYAEAKIAKVYKLNSGFMRRLLEENYELKYCRFTLTAENEIAIVFDSYTVDGSPYKLYAALKELATHADKHDDLLIEEFSVLKHLEHQVRRELPEIEKEVKYQFIMREIRSSLHEIDHGNLNSQRYPVGITYLLLYLCYKLDYLTKPEGFLMESLERIHRLAFAQDGKNVAQKNMLLRKEFEKLLKRPREKFFREMYEVSSTFGITAPIDHPKVALIIEQELPNMKWYRDNSHEKVALSIPGFIAGRCLFYFAVPLPDKDFFHLLLQVLEAGYFRDLGFSVYVENGVIDEKGLKRAIRNIAEKHKKNYPGLNPDVKRLVFSTVAGFAESYCWMIRDLDLTKVE